MERKTVSLKKLRTTTNHMIQHAPTREARLAICMVYEAMTLGLDHAYHGYGYTRDFHEDDTYRFYYGEQDSSEEPIKLWSAKAS